MNIILSIVCAAAVLHACPAYPLSSLKLIETTNINNDKTDIVFGEIADNSDTVIYLYKDSLASSSEDWSFVLYNLTKGDSLGVITKGSPDVFYGFTVGPGNSVIYARDAALSAGGVRGIYYATFYKLDSGLIELRSAYPAYVASNEAYNFAFVRDSGTVFVAGMYADTPAYSASAVRIFDLSVASTGNIRFLRWSPDAKNLVFMHEEKGESQASIYILKDIQSLARRDSPVTSLADSTYMTRVTSDSYYNAFPHFTGGDQFILYSRTHPFGNFRFSNFSDTGGCTTIVIPGTNWDVLLLDRSRGETWSVDTDAATAAVSSSASHRGYILMVNSLHSETDGNISFSAISSTQNVNASSSGLFYFPTNARINLQAGAVPTCSFTVAPDTPKSQLKNDTRQGEVEKVIAPVHISLSVPTDSTDRLKMEVILYYHDVELARFVELATNSLVYDTQSKSWKGTGSGLNTTSNTVTFAPPHFSVFGVGMSSVFNINLLGESCIVRRWTDLGCLSTALRRARDVLIGFSWGRRLVGRYYEL